MNIPSWISTPSPTKTWKQSNSGFYILWIGFWFYSLEEGIECYHTCIPKKWTAYRKRQPNLCSKCFKEKTTTTVVATFPLSQVPQSINQSLYTMMPINNFIPITFPLSMSSMGVITSHGVTYRPIHLKELSCLGRLSWCLFSLSWSLLFFWWI